MRDHLVHTFLESRNVETVDDLLQVLCFFELQLLGLRLTSNKITWIMFTFDWYGIPLLIIVT